MPNKKLQKRKEQGIKYRKEHKKECADYAKRYFQVHKEKLKLYKKIYRETHKKEAKEYLEKNRERLNQMKRINHQKNKEKEKKQKQEYDKKNRNELRKKEKERFHINIQFKLQKILRGRLYSALKKNLKSGSAVRDLGCSIPELKIYLQNKFQEGMNWNNWKHSGWHIDHIIPISTFNLTNREDFLKACHYTNLQPMWGNENMKKSNKTYGK